MNYRGLNLNQLVSLQVLLDERHVTRSAEQLGITQPAMSASLARLRTLFGDQLLVRSPQGLMRTPRAEQLHEQLGRMMAIVEQITSTPVGFEPSTSQRSFSLIDTDFVEVICCPNCRPFLRRRRRRSRSSSRDRIRGVSRELWRQARST